MTQTDMTQTEPPKRYVYANGKRQPTAFQYATSRNDGSLLVVYQTRGCLVYAIFDDADLDIARACCPYWDARHGRYRIVRSRTRAERAARVDRGERPGGSVRAYELVIERMLGRSLAAGYLEVIDHIDSDPLNNHRSNLRALSNRLNTVLRTDVKTSERLPGASYAAGEAAKGSRKPWQALWRETGRRGQQLGWFRTELEAFAAWASRMEREQPGWRIALAAHPALLDRLDRLTAAEGLSE